MPRQKFDRIDESKLCDGLGPGFPLPVEIGPSAGKHTMNTIAALPSLAGAAAEAAPLLRCRTTRRTPPTRPSPTMATTLSTSSSSSSVERRDTTLAGIKKSRCRRARPLLRHDDVGHHRR